MGLSLAYSVPDYSSNWDFHQFLKNEGLIDSLLVTLNWQLSIQGLWFRTGEISIIDGNNTQDTEVGWNLKERSVSKCKGSYGFKAHANVDDDGFIKTAFTLGNEHD